MRSSIDAEFMYFLQSNWEEQNLLCFQRRLKQPVWQISDTVQTLGSWDRQKRLLSISRKLLLERSEEEILEVLKHEMAHQYADEILGAYREETPHGNAFRFACEKLGIEHNARYHLESEPPPILQRIRKLLALAESENVHEAEAAMARAKALMEKYEVEIGNHEHHFHYQFLGPPRKQKSIAIQFCAGILSRFFQVKVVWIRTQLLHEQKGVWLLEICGSKTQLEIAEYVFDYLTRELERLWLHHKRKHPHLKGKSPKRDYQAGVLRGLIKKLEGSDQSETGRQLVLVKQEKLDRFFRDRHPHLHSGRRVTYRKSREFDAGYHQGQNLELRQGLRADPEKTKTIGHKKAITSGK